MTQQLLKQLLSVCMAIVLLFGMHVELFAATVQNQPNDFSTPIIETSDLPIDKQFITPSALEIEMTTNGRLRNNASYEKHYDIRNDNPDMFWKINTDHIVYEVVITDFGAQGDVFFNRYLYDQQQQIIAGEEGASITDMLELNRIMKIRIVPMDAVLQTYRFVNGSEHPIDVHYLGGLLSGRLALYLNQWLEDWPRDAVTNVPMEYVRLNPGESMMFKTGLGMPDTTKGQSLSGSFGYYFSFNQITPPPEFQISYIIESDAPATFHPSQEVLNSAYALAGSTQKIVANLETNETVNEEGLVGTWMFHGWKTGSDILIEDDQFIMPEHDVEFVGTWTFVPDVKSVSYRCMGISPKTHTELPDEQIYPVGTKVFLAEILTTTETMHEQKTGQWTCSTWFTEDVIVEDGAFNMPNNDVIFNCEWTFTEDEQQPEMTEEDTETSNEDELEEIARITDGINEENKEAIDAAFKEEPTEQDSLFGTDMDNNHDTSDDQDQTPQNDNENMPNESAQIVQEQPNHSLEVAQSNDRENNDESDVDTPHTSVAPRPRQLQKKPSQPTQVVTANVLSTESSQSIDNEDVVEKEMDNIMPPVLFSDDHVPEGAYSDVYQDDVFVKIDEADDNSNFIVLMPKTGVGSVVKFALIGAVLCLGGALIAWLLIREAKK